MPNNGFINEKPSLQDNYIFPYLRDITGFTEVTDPYTYNRIGRDMDIQGMIIDNPNNIPWYNSPLLDLGLLAFGGGTSLAKNVPLRNLLRKGNDLVKDINKYYGKLVGSGLITERMTDPIMDEAAAQYANGVKYSANKLFLDRFKGGRYAF